MLFLLSCLLLIWYTRRPKHQSNMPAKIHLHIGDVVALIEDLPRQGLRSGQVGTIVEILTDSAYEVEFSDDEGHTYATLALTVKQLMVLHYGPVEVA
ncbi:MAG: hypothetical protein QOH93_2028 [Chloroflexia bacterium]|nr:hypothetical protein [Chloroflexia bacterium]